MKFKLKKCKSLLLKMFSNCKWGESKHPSKEIKAWSSLLMQLFSVEQLFSIFWTTSARNDFTYKLFNPHEREGEKSNVDFICKFIFHIAKVMIIKDNSYNTVRLQNALQSPGVKSFLLWMYERTIKLYPALVYAVFRK